MKNKINCTLSESVTLVSQRKNELILSIIPLLTDLNWYDFELLVDLIFTNSGWKRLERTGGTGEFVDLDLILPLSNRRASVQVKSTSTSNEYEEYLKKFGSMTQYDEFYYFVNRVTDSKLLKRIESGDKKIVTGYRLGELVLSCGLLDWIIEKTS